jgi:flagellar hook protein FlgE
MSVSSAMDTAVSGLTAQSVAFSNLSNNMANSQTVGYKAVDTSFSDFVEASGALEGQSGNVLASTQYANQTTGAITASTANGALAINGNGFFAVNELSGQSNTSTPSFSTTQYYTRAGDFQSDKNGYLVNSAGEYLDGFTANATTGSLNTSSLAPINVDNIAYHPTATTTVTMAPTVASTGGTSTQTVYDASGIASTIGLNWSQTTPATPTTGAVYSLAVSGTTAATPPTATVAFNLDGTMASVTAGSPAATTATGTADFNIGTVGAGTTAISLDLGTIGSASASTTVGTTFAAGTPTQDGTAAGSQQTGFAMETDGSVVANFANGETQLIGKVPLATFGNANALQAQDGQAYTATAGSGAATLQAAATNGAGSLETKSVEGSTTSLDTDLTKLIVAQQAYAASAKVVTTANEMLQTALAMKQ